MFDQKTVLITGANRGIGLALAQKFSKEGYRVIMSGRSLQKLERAKEQIQSANIYLLPLDVTAIESIKEAAAILEKEFGRLDILINNAAILPGTENSLLASEDTVRETLDTNVIGVWRVIKEFHSLLSRSEDPRIINISSGMGSISEMGSGYLAYRLSKVALNGLTSIVQADLGSKFRVVSVCPGWVKTDMGGSGAPRSPERAAEQIFWLGVSAEVQGGKFYRDKKIINW